MRDLGSSVLESRREGSRLVMVVMGFLVKGGCDEDVETRRLQLQGVVRGGVSNTQGRAC